MASYLHSRCISSIAVALLGISCSGGGQRPSEPGGRGPGEPADPVDATTGDATPGEHADHDAAQGDASQPDASMSIAPVVGYADLHLHMMAEEAFGGGWFHGSHQGAEALALASCDGGFPGDHARLRSNLSAQFGTCQDAEPPVDLSALASSVPFLNLLLNVGGTPASEFLGAIEGTGGDTGVHQGRKSGFPDYSGWPRWDTIAHQQSWEGWLEQAHRDGLRVVVMSAVSFDWLCKALPSENLVRPQCDEMDDVRRQLQLAHELDARHDWLEIALSASDARRIASEGKLAMLLSIEASSLFGAADLSGALEEVYGMGVRTLQLVHQLDNRFGGAAPHNPIFHIAQFTRNCHVDSDCGLTSADTTLGFDVDADCKNVRGLTDEGKQLVQAMMERHMLIDAAHMSERTTADVFALAEANDFYPVYVSHGHLRELMLPAKQREEKTTPASIIKGIRRTGGLFGLRTAHEEVSSYPASQVDNSCHGSTRSLAQAIAFATRGLKVDLALGTDFNGFIQQTRPRFGDDGACSASFAAEATCQRDAQRTSGPQGLGTELDRKGFAHIGLLGALMADLEQLGVETAIFEGSAERTIRMWERAEGTRAGPASDAADMDVSGIVVGPDKATRQGALPKVCDTAYCPDSRELGESCSFSEECKEGTCSSGLCGVPMGTCVR
ncbi:MAG: membrane dipeptidase [Myxococcales bacterium]